MKPLPWLFLILLSAPLPAQGEEEPYTFFFKNRVVRPNIHSVHGTPAQPAPGDIVEMGDWAFVLDAPGRYNLEIRDDFEGSLWRVLPSESRLLAYEFRVPDPDGPRRHKYPLELSRQNRATLRGLRVVDWNPRIARELARLDLSRICVAHSFDRPAAVYRRTPFPTHVRALVAYAGDRECLAALRFPKIEFLNLDGFRGNLPVLASAKSILALSLRPIENWTMPATFFKNRLALRSLTVENVVMPKAAPAMAEIPDLRRLIIKRGELGPFLIDWKPQRLEQLILTHCHFDALPREPWPALREAEILRPTFHENPKQKEVNFGSEIKRFQAAHSHASIRASLRDVFLHATQGCDRARLRDGGACCPPHHAAYAFYEIRGAAEIAELQALIRPREGQGGAIFSCGAKALEFYRGEHLIATIGIDDIRQKCALLTWGGWPGQSLLEEESARHLRQWCQRRTVSSGISGDENAASRRWQTYAALLPAELCPKRYHTPADLRTILDAWAIMFNSPRQFASRAFQVYGCHEDSWNVDAAADAAVREKALPLIDAGVLIDLATSTDTTEAERNGIARWLFADGALRQLDDDALARVCTGIGREALLHPRVINRRYAMASLASHNTPATRGLLLEVVAGRLAIPKTEVKRHDDAAGRISAFPERPNIPDDTPDAVAAAMHLLHAGGTEGRTALAAALDRVPSPGRDAIEALLK